MTDDSETAKQLRPRLWETVNERYPGSMITKVDLVSGFESFFGPQTTYS